MILPNVRASFGEREAVFLDGLMQEYGAPPDGAWSDRLERDGLDAVLDDPRTLNALMSGPRVSAAPAAVVCYVLVRHALLESGMDDRTLADYIAALVLARGSTESDAGMPGSYLIDVVAAIAESDGDEAFQLQAHLGELALWLAGLFPDHVAYRVRRRGAPGLRYYDQLGAAGYRLAARTRGAADIGLGGLYRDCASRFTTLRVALNRVSDRYLFPRSAPSVDRLLRQLASREERDSTAS